MGKHILFDMGLLVDPERDQRKIRVKCLTADHSPVESITGLYRTDLFEKLRLRAGYEFRRLIGFFLFA